MTDEPQIGPDSPTKWGPYPGDATQPPPTPQAPEIPISSRWLWMAGLGVAARVAILAVVLIVVVIVVAVVA